jgi:branched-chain amino acid transport system permease protein
MRSGDFRERYEDDLALLQSPAARVWLGLLVVGLVAFPLVASKYLAYVVNVAGIAVVGALGLNLLTGSTGQISLGHSAFLAIGGYTSAILVADHGIPFWLTLPLAGLAAARRPPDRDRARLRGTLSSPWRSPSWWSMSWPLEP